MFRVCLHCIAGLIASSCKGIVLLPQVVLNPLQQALAQGCHLTRDTLGTLLEEACCQRQASTNVLVPTHDLPQFTPSHSHSLSTQPSAME